MVVDGSSLILRCCRCPGSIDMKEYGSESEALLLLRHCVSDLPDPEPVVVERASFPDTCLNNYDTVPAGIPISNMELMLWKAW